MNPWVDRGRLFLAIIFGAMLLTYLGERLVYYAVTGFSLSLSSVVVVALLISASNQFARSARSPQMTPVDQRFWHVRWSAPRSRISTHSSP